MNLVMGIFCFGAAVTMLIYQEMTGDRRLLIRGTDVSAAWLLLVLSGWNLARWYSAYSWRKVQRRVRDEQAARLRQIRDHDRPPRDPTFDFTDPPRPEGPAVQ